MSASLLDGTCDAHASIAISSPIKGLTLVPEDLKVDLSQDVDVSQPPVDGSASLSPLKPSASIDIANEALIHKLLESLEALKTQDSRTNSGATSPSPLTISTGGSADPIPSSPTDYNYSSPVGPLTREHSTDSLAAAVQHLSLSSHRRPTTTAAAPAIALQSSTHHPSTLNLSGLGTQATNSTWSAPITNAATAITGAAAEAVTPATPLQMPSFPAQQASLFSTSIPAYSSNTTTFPVSANATTAVAAAAGVASAVAAPPLAAYQQPLYTPDHLSRVQAQMQLFRMLAPPPTPVHFEECLTGIDGAYQSYCRQVINNEINVAALRMLAHVKAAQLTDSPAVSRLIGKRYFCSLKEVSKVVAGSRMLLIAPDVRPSISAHIKPVRLLQMVMAAADAAGVPYVFCLSRRGIGQVFGRDKSMSIVAVMHIDGVENEYVTLLEHAAQGRELYATRRGSRPTTTNSFNPLGAVGVGVGGLGVVGGSSGGGFPNSEFLNMNYYGPNQHAQRSAQSGFSGSSYLNPQLQFQNTTNNNTTSHSYTGVGGFQNIY